MPQANYRFEARPCEPKPPFEGGLPPVRWSSRNSLNARPDSLSLIARGARRRVHECLGKKASHRRSSRAPATAGSLFPRNAMAVEAAAPAPLLRPDPCSRVMRWPSKPPFKEKSWRSMNRRFGAVGLRDQDLPALFKSSKSNGSERSRLPVAAKIAFETAGAMGGTPGSPTPVGGWSDFTI
jgi:hypothetical protein